MPNVIRLGKNALLSTLGMLGQWSCGSFLGIRYVIKHDSTLETCRVLMFKVETITTIIQHCILQHYRVMLLCVSCCCKLERSHMYLIPSVEQRLRWLHLWVSFVSELQLENFGVEELKVLAM